MEVVRQKQKSTAWGFDSGQNVENFRGDRYTERKRVKCVVMTDRGQTLEGSSGRSGKEQRGTV
jgi:hypothetical protein